MKVAIIGAGFSGLACACELEKHGILPVIYEKKAYIGETYPHVSAILEITHRPIKDAMVYCREKLGLEIKPLNTINTLIHNSAGITTTIHGNFGYFLKNNREPDCVRRQLSDALKKSVIRLETFADYRQLEKEYDRVVIASGNDSQAQELGCWQTWIDSYVKGAYIQGNFDPNTLVMWINKGFCKNGYAYLTPFDGTRACIVLVATDVNEKEVELYWDMFWDFENLKYDVIETFKLRHIAGYAYPLTLGKLIFVGNSAGGFDSFLGFGLINALTMGVSAARTIATGVSYEKQIKRTLERNRQFRQFRKAFNSLSNKGQDNLITLIGLPGIRHFLYNTRINIIKPGAFLLKPFTKKQD